MGTASASSSVRWLSTACALLACALTLPAAPAPRLPAGAGEPVRVIVAAQPGREALAATDVRSLGGRVGPRLGIINGFEAELPAAALPALRGLPEIRQVAPNRRLHLNATAYDPAGDVGSAYNTTLMTGAQAYWRAGYTGRGVDVALIDSGVVPVNGLTTPGKVVNGPDLSPESQAPSLRYLDTYGHGTHLAGLIAGRDDGTKAGQYAGQPQRFLGMAPDARLVNVKVADAVGETDVSQVIASIDWVVQHRHDHGLDIRVINLAFGSDTDQRYETDPLAYAAEVAWQAGIVVVVAAGNAGWRADGLNDPAYDPMLLAVGAADTQGSLDAREHTVAAFSNRGAQDRPADIYAPGVHVVGLRDPGSSIDDKYGKTGRVGSRFFRGSGTSQATAIVAGAAALVLQQHPNATPDQVKRLLTDTASRFSEGDDRIAQGRGQLDLAAALNGALPDINESEAAPGTGNGSLEASRGGLHVLKDGRPLSGEQDIFGHPVDTDALAQLEAAHASWQGGRWNGGAWSGSSWDASSWTGSSWDTTRWAGSSWSGSSWDGSSWTSSSWDGSSWTSSSWDGSSWTDAAWSVAFWG